MARVGFDIDGVLYDFEDALREYLEDNDYTYPMPVATQWHFAEQWGMTRQEFDGWCKDALRYGHLFDGCHGFPGVREQLQRVRDAGHTIVLITARDFGHPMTARSQTQRWLVDYNIPHDELWMRQASQKHTIKVDYFIDDNLDVYHRMLGAGVKAFLHDRPYNQHVSVGSRGSLKGYVDSVLAVESVDTFADERADVLARFQEELSKATGDGSKKRKAGEKPPWYRDNSHEGAIFSHITKWKRGEKVDPDSGAHPLVHAAWRCLAIACQESGNIPGSEGLTSLGGPGVQVAPERPAEGLLMPSGGHVCVPAECPVCGPLISDLFRHHNK
jgi:uncharacterized HAD superfamily protein